jgi:hypothetical protein
MAARVGTRTIIRAAPVGRAPLVAWRCPVDCLSDDLGGPLAWDLAFLGFGVLLVVGGLALARPGRVGSRAGAYLR